MKTGNLVRDGISYSYGSGDATVPSMTLEEYKAQLDKYKDKLVNIEDGEGGVITAEEVACNDGTSVEDKTSNLESAVDSINGTLQGGEKTVTDANSINEIGMFRLNSGALNVPFSSNTPWIIFNTYNNGSRGVQFAWLYYPWESGNMIYVRYRHDGWGEWRRFYTNSMSDWQVIEAESPNPAEIEIVNNGSMMKDKRLNINLAMKVKGQRGAGWAIFRFSGIDVIGTGYISILDATDRTMSIGYWGGYWFMCADALVAGHDYIVTGVVDSN